MTYSFLLFLIIFSCTSKLDYSYNKNDIPGLIRKHNQHVKMMDYFIADSHITLNYKKENKIVSDDIRSEAYIVHRDTFFLKFVYSIFNANVASFYIDPSYYAFMIKNPKEADNFIRGLSNDGYINQLFQIDIPLSLWDDYLFSAHWVIDSVFESSQIMENGELKLTYKDKIIHFDENLAVIKKVSFITDNKILGEIFYNAYIEKEKFLLATEINYYNKRLGSEMFIQNQSIKVNKRPDLSKLKINIHTKMDQIIYD